MRLFKLFEMGSHKAHSWNSCRNGQPALWNKSFEMHKLLEASGLAAVVFPDGNKTNWMLLHLRSLVKPSNLPQELLFPAKRYSWTLWHLEILSSPSSVPKVLFCLIKLQSLEIESSQLTILLKFSIPGLPHNLAIAFTSLAYSSALGTCDSSNYLKWAFTRHTLEIVVEMCSPHSGTNLSKCISC